MVITKVKKKAAASSKTEENKAAENALAETLTSDSVTVELEVPEVDAQLEDKVDITVEARNEKPEGMSGEEESERATKLDIDDENELVAELYGDDKAVAEENNFEDDETVYQEGMLWDDDEENTDNEERDVDEHDFSDEEATEEENEDDDVSEDQATEEDDGKVEVSEDAAAAAAEEEEEEEEEDDDDDDDDDDEENTPEEKEIAKQIEIEAKPKEAGREAEDHNIVKLEESLKTTKKKSGRSRKKKVLVDRSKKVGLVDKPESSHKGKTKKRVESMGMIFMCSSKTKKDCYQYRVFGLPESKKAVVEKIYTGMRLFLYDVDLKLMYGIYKAAGPGGYNIEPKAFKSQFPSQVRFKVLDNCLPLAEEKFKKVIKGNYFTKTKFDCKLNSEQVKKLCKLFVASSKGRSSKKLGKSIKAEKKPIRRETTRRQRTGGERHPPLREVVQYHERPRKRPRKVISPTPPLHQSLLPAPLPSTIPSSYVYERTSDVDAYRRELYSRRRYSFRDRPDPLLSRLDPYEDRRDPPVDRNDRYRDGRDPYLDRHYVYRDARDPYVELHDPYKDDRDPYLRRLDPYRDARDPYLELHDLYRDRQDPNLERRDSYRDGRDPYLNCRVPHRDATRSEVYNYRRDLLTDSRDVHRDDRRVEHRNPYRQEELLGTRQRHDIASHDSYVSTRERPLYAEPIYSAEYPSRAGVRHL